MTQHENVEFQGAPGTVSPLIMDNLARAILPQVAEANPHGVVAISPDGQEVTLAVLSSTDSTDASNKKYALTLRPAPQTGDLQNPSTQTTYYFGENCMLYVERPLPPDDETKISKKSDSSIEILRSNIMPEDHLQQVLGAWITSEAVNIPGRHMLEQLRATRYVPVKLPNPMHEGANPALATARHHLESAVQMIAHESVMGLATRDGDVVNKWKETRQGDSEFCNSFCLRIENPPFNKDEALKKDMTPETLDLTVFFTQTETKTADLFNTPQKTIDQLKQSIRDELGPAPHKRAEELLGALTEGRVQYQCDISYEYHPSEDLLARTAQRSYVVYESPIELCPDSDARTPIDQVTLHKDDRQFDLSGKQDATAQRSIISNAQSQPDSIFEWWSMSEFKPGLDQQHLEEISSILSCLGLMSLPTRWG